ncbi:MAG: hypothetical protein OXI83_16480 [Gemmatimonadota bacterium]|nr:hypothetical protein [Gemmatimonadota bacterium]
MATAWGLSRSGSKGLPIHSAALLFTLVGAVPEPAASQEGRQMAAFISPNVACRVAPSTSAEVAGFLRQLGEFRESIVEEVGSAETDDDGEVWIHVGPDYTRWAGLSAGCWVHESVLVPIDGYTLTEAHLLLMADRLLSSPEGRTLTDLVAYYNVFTHPRYREMVERSPALVARRQDLLARALRVVETERLAARDPLVVAWLESLGEEAEDALPGGEVREPPPPGDRALAIIAPDVACRSAPAASPTPRAATLRLDHHFTPERADTTVSGDDWTFVFDGCWVPASLTAPADSDEHVLAIADRFLSASEGRSTENLLRVYNVLSDRNGGHRHAVEISGILGLRRLELIERWLATFNSRDADPLTRAVVRSLDEEVQHFDPAGVWILRDDAWLALYERHQSRPEAHEILWKLATSEAHEDCEGHFACHTRSWVLNRVGRYWFAYPDGPRVVEAVARAHDRLRGFLEACNAARDAGPDSREFRRWEGTGWEENGAETVRELRASLREVADEDRAPLVELLDALEGCAGDG